VELDEAMRTTGAVREFRPEPVPDDVVHRVLDVARFAPSGANIQPWTVLVLTDPGVRARIRDLARLGWREYVAHVRAGLRPFAPGPDGRWHGPGVDLDEARRTDAPSAFVDGLDTAPVLLVVLARLTALAVTDVDADRQSIAGGASIYPFVQNILLAARDVGLGGTMATFLARQEPAVKEVLGIPDDHAVAALIALGWPARQVRRLRRREVAEFTRIDGFDGPAFPPGSSAPSPSRLTLGPTRPPTPGPPPPRPGSAPPRPKG
jgi:nitroreductase